MEFDFIPDKNSLYIPKEAYRPIKRCPFCSSVFLKDNFCESCTRMIDYNFVGLPFSTKSFYRLKEKYIESLPFSVRLFNILEDKKSDRAKSYVRNMYKRYEDLLHGLTTFEIIRASDRKYFMIEIKTIIDELFFYGFDPKKLKDAILEFESEDLIMQELIQYLDKFSDIPKKIEPAQVLILRTRLFNLIRLDNFLIFTILMATLIYVAIKMKSFYYH